MSPLYLMLVELAEGLPEGAGTPELGVRIELSSAEVSVPIETRMGRGGMIEGCAPRNRWITGFQLPVGRLSASFSRGLP